MDVWQRTCDQLRDLFRGLSAAQRVTLLIVSVGMLGGMGWVVWNSAIPAEDFLLGGKNFSPEELQQTQAALKASGLTEFKVVGQKIAVPAEAADRYTAAALARQTLPAQFAADFDRMQSKVNLFTSNEQRRELLEEARKTRLAQILRAIPEIEDAVVEWDRPRQTNLFRPAPQIAAHVSVKPRDGRELSAELVQSLKLFVAGALAGARVDDVTVVDMNTSRVHGRQSPTDAASERRAGLAKQHEAEYVTELSRALSYIPHVLVSVNVRWIPAERTASARRPYRDTEFVPAAWSHRTTGAKRHDQPNRALIHPVKSNSIALENHFEQAVTNIDAGDDSGEDAFDAESADRLAATEDSRLSDFRKTVRVSVSIPETYYAAVAEHRGCRPGSSLVQDSAYRAALANIKAETQLDVRHKLERLLADNAVGISVSTYTPVSSPSDAELPRAVSNRQLWYGIELNHLKLGTGLTICGTCLFCGLLWLRPERSGIAGTMTLAPHPALSEETATVTDVPDDYPVLHSHPHAAVLAELAELDRRAAVPIVPRKTPFSFLNELSVWQAAQLLETEHPQTIALVATALAPAQAAEILHAMPESLRWDVTQRLTRIGPAAPDVLCQVAASLQSRLGAQPIPPKMPLAESLPSVNPRELPAEPPQRPLPNVPQNPPATTATFDFQFDDLLNCDPKSLAMIAELIDPRACAVALLDRGEAVKQSLLTRLPKAFTTEVRQCLRNLGPVRLSDITTTQQEIAQLVCDLATQGRLQIPT